MGKEWCESLLVYYKLKRNVLDMKQDLKDVEYKHEIQKKKIKKGKKIHVENGKDEDFKRILKMKRSRRFGQDDHPEEEEEDEEDVLSKCESAVGRSKSFVFF